MSVMRRPANEMERLQALVEAQGDEIERLRGRLQDAAFRERGLHEALRRETDNSREAVSETGRLRKAIEKAPHADYCEARSPIFPGPCTCWKRSTLHPIGAVGP